MLLQVRDLSKRFGRSGPVASDGISLDVGAGEVYGLLGHNGAGKTTLVNQVVGLVKPDAGSILIDGHDAIADPGSARRLCAVQPQAQIPIAGLTPRQAIALIGQMRGSSGPLVKERSEALTEALQIGEWLDVEGAKLSGGVKRLVSFCMAAVAPGKLAILDEPTNDVDPVRRRLLWKQVRALADEGVGVLLVTHNVVEAERSVDRLAILDRGRVLAEGTPASLKASFADHLRLELVIEPDRPVPILPEYGLVQSTEGARLLAHVPARAAGDAAAWCQSLVRDGLIEEFTLAPATLEDAYIALMPRDGVVAQEVSDDRAA
jgi:ABC-2 type transport system ATP-binding protein